MWGCCAAELPKEVLLGKDGGGGKPGPSEATPLSGKRSVSLGQRAFDCLTAGRPSNIDALPSGKWHAFFNEMMCLIGIGSLTLPYATEQVGLALSLGGLALLCYFSWEGIRFVAYCAAEERKKRTALQLSRGTEAVEDKGAWHVISTAGYGVWGWYGVSATLAVAQLGVAASYVDQIRGTLEFVWNVQGSTSLPVLWSVLTLISLQMNPGMRTVAWLSG